MTGVILMGGKSRRFGQDKVMATIGDKPLIEHVIEAIAPLMEDIILIGPARPGMRGCDAWTISSRTAAPWGGSIPP